MNTLNSIEFYLETICLLFKFTATDSFLFNDFMAVVIDFFDPLKGN